jgi:hypothetical protein
MREVESLESLSGKLEEIAKETRNATIRQMTEECLKAIQ